MSDAYYLGQLRKSLIKACIWQVARHEHLLSGTEAKSQTMDLLTSFVHPN